MTSEPTYLFVYGTLCQASGHPSYGLLEEGAQLIGRARMNGQLYEIDGYPGVVPSSVEGEYVVGELYRLLKPEAVLAGLDDYEEAGESYPEPWEYKRCLVTVEPEDGQEMAAWCYLYNRPTDGRRLIPSGDWCR